MANAIKHKYFLSLARHPSAGTAIRFIMSMIYSDD